MNKDNCTYENRVKLGKAIGAAVLSSPDLCPNCIIDMVLTGTIAYIQSGIDKFKNEEDIPSAKEILLERLSILCDIIKEGEAKS